MSTKAVLTIVTTLLSLDLFATQPENINIFCGSMNEGNAVEFIVSPSTSEILYRTYFDGSMTLQHGLGPTEKIYGTSNFSLTRSDDIATKIEIHGFYEQIYRINYYHSVTIKLGKVETNGYRLAAFSEGFDASSSVLTSVREEEQSEFLGLMCVVSE